jgi:hypothetical protein
MQKVIVLSRYPLNSLKGAGLRTLHSYLENSSFPLINIFWENALPNSSLVKENLIIPIPLTNSINVIKNILGYKIFFRKHIGLNQTVIIVPDSFTELLAMSLCSSAQNKILFMMDDFISAQCFKISKLKSFIIKKIFQYIINNFTQIWSISDFMKNYLTNTYKVKVNAVFPPCKNQKPLKYKYTEKVKKILYVGSTSSPYNEPLLKLSEINLDSLDLTIDIYSDTEPDTKILANKRIQYRGNFEEKNKLFTFNQYDIGLITYSFNKNNINLMRYSFPSKFLDYIFSGLAILSILPKNLEISSWLQAQHLGPVCNSIDNLQSFMKDFCDINFANSYGEISIHLERLQNKFSFETHSKIMYGLISGNSLNESKPTLT